VEIKPRTSKLLGSFWGAESTGYFLLHLDHVNVALGLVVIERDTQVVEEEQKRKISVLYNENRAKRFCALDFAFRPRFVSAGISSGRGFSDSP
jgi:hypothetical protein